MNFLNSPRTLCLSVGTLRWGPDTLWYSPSTLMDPPRTLRSSVGKLHCCSRIFLNSPRTLCSNVGTLRWGHDTLWYSPSTLIDPPRTLLSSVGYFVTAPGFFQILIRPCAKCWYTSLGSWFTSLLSQDFSEFS